MTQPSPADRRPISLLIPAIAGAMAAVLVVGLVWLVVRDSDEEVVADDLPTTSEGASETTVPGIDESTDTTDDGSATTEVSTPEVTTIDNVPLSDLPADAPNTFVAVTSDTFELVIVDSRSGEVLQELGSWTPDLADGAEPDQALQMVELAPSGTIYVDDCCEPAYGTTFIVSGTFDPAATPRLDGEGPEISPDGSRLARSSVGSAVSITDAEGSQLGLIGEPDFSGPILSPLTWVDSSTLVVSESDPTKSDDRLLVLDVSDPSSPVEISVGAEPGRFYAAADVRADGNILVVVRRFDPEVGSTNADDVVAEIIDPESGETVAEFDLPDDVYEANYDATGRYVVTVRTSGQLDWYGAGKRGTLGNGFISADW